MSGTSSAQSLDDRFDEAPNLVQLLADTSEFVWCINSESQLLYLNSGARRLLGVDEDYQSGETDFWQQWLPEEEIAGWQAACAEALETGQAELTHRIINQHGDIVWLKNSLSRIDGHDGEADQLAGLAANVTSIKRQQAELQNSEAIYHSLIDSLPVNVLRKNLDGRRIFANQHYCELHGQPLEQLIGKSNDELFPGELAAHYSADDVKVMEDGESIRRIEPYETPNGAKFHIEVVKSPVRDEQGQIVGTQVVFWDVSERLQAESALEYERHLLHALLDNIPDSIYFKDRDSRFVRVSKSMAEKFGLPRVEDAMGKTDADFFTEEHAQQAREDEMRVIETEEPFVGAVERETWADREDTWCSTTKLPLYDRDGHIIGTFGISRDITALKVAEDALERERDLLRTLMDQLPDLIFVKDRDCRFVTVNNAMLRAFGVDSVHEVVGKTDFEFSSPEMAQHYMDDDQQVMDSGNALLAREEGLTDPRGLKRWLLTSKVPLRNSFGEVTGLVGIGRDITKLKRFEKELVNAKEAADAANRAKSDFLACMSHEIRTPMNAIIGMTELLLDTDLTSAQQEYLQMVRESGEALLTIINDILDFSKIEAGKMDLESQPFDLRDSLGDTMKSLAVRAHAKELELAMEIHSDVPFYVVGDIARLRQILVNLVGNAIKFTHEGEVVVTINSVSHSDEDVTLQFDVRDTGIGIPAEKCENIFEEFEQADNSTTRSFGGTGLGLAISSRLSAMMGGSIWVKSKLGHGSTFSFQVKLQTTNVEMMPRLLPSDVELEAMPVLIVDDNATNRRIMEEMSKSMGMIPKSVDTAPLALAELRDASQRGVPYKLLLSDVNMPDVDGYTLAGRIRNDPTLAGLTIVMLTSSGRPGDAALREELDIRMCLMKPVKQSELFDGIVSALSRSIQEIKDQEKQKAAVPEDTSELEPLRILLAEDNIVNQKLALGLLGKQGHEVIVAENGSIAFDAWKNGGFDLILMDVQMPEMDGFAATHAIREAESQMGDGRHIPIIAMTARAMKGDREKCLDAGMDDYISKPIQTQLLWEKCAKLMQSRGVEAPTAEACSSANDDALIDWELALQTVNGDRDLLAIVIDAFQTEVQTRLADVRAAVEESDALKLRRSAHTIKGALLALGSTLTSGIAGELELLGKQWEDNGDFLAEEVSGPFSRLEQQLQQLSHELANYAP